MVVIKGPTPLATSNITYNAETLLACIVKISSDL